MYECIWLLFIVHNLLNFFKSNKYSQDRSLMHFGLFALVLIQAYKV